MGAVVILARQKHAVFLAECGLEHEWLSTQQNAVECFSSLEHIEAIVSLTGEIIDKVIMMGVVGMLSRRKHAVCPAEFNLEH